MGLRDTTHPRACGSDRALLGAPAAGDAFDLVSRLRFHIAGIYSSEVGTEWDSGGRAESDYLHHIELVFSGRRHVSRGDCTLELEPGSIYFLPGNTPVTRHCRERCRLLYMTFRCEWLPGVDPLLDWPQRRHVRIGPLTPDDWHLWLRPGWSPGPNQLLRLHAHLEEWMCAVLPDLGTLIRRHLETHGRFAAVFDLVEAQLGADLRVADLAQAHGTTPDAFSMAFLRNVGIRPKEYLNRRLNQAALQMVINGQFTMKEVAARLHFSDEFYFSRFFRKLNGISPSHYRERFRRME